MFPNSYLHHIKYRNLILFLGDEIFCKRSVDGDKSLHLLVSEAAAWKFSQLLLLKGLFQFIHVAYKHFVTWRINLIHYMLNKFKNNFFCISLQKYLAVTFQGFFVKVYIIQFIHVAYKHFVTWRINLIHYMLNKFKNNFFCISLQKYLAVTFQGFFVKVYINDKPKRA